MKGGNNERNLRQALLGLRNDQKLADLEPLLSFLASFVFDIPLLQQMTRWDMTVLCKSPWYNEILKEGLQQGLQEGSQEGRQEGEAQLVLRQLQRRFGELAPERAEQIRGLSVERLEELGLALLDFTGPEDLDRYLGDC